MVPSSEQREAVLKLPDWSLTGPERFLTGPVRFLTVPVRFLTVPVRFLTGVVCVPVAVFFSTPTVAQEPASVQEWNILALRVDFPFEELDELTTTGRGEFDLRSPAEAESNYDLPFDIPPHDRRYFEHHLDALASYYRVVSEGQVEISYSVFPRELKQAYTLPFAALDYGNGRTDDEIDAKWGQLLVDAVAEAAGAGEDGPIFSDFDSFLLFHAGVGHETGLLNDIRSVYLSPADLERILPEPILVGDEQFQVSDAWILPEAASFQGQGGLNGLLAKFFGHQLGLPGLSNFADGLPAVGGWSLMDVGANALGFVTVGDSLNPIVGFVPSHPMAWSKARLGWIEPVEVLRDTTISLIATDRSADLAKALRIPITENEYFLVENRQQRGELKIAGSESRFAGREIVEIDGESIEFSGEGQSGVWRQVGEWDAFVPGSGILIWHVDETRIAEALIDGFINDDPNRPGIVLEEADGYRDIGNPNFDRLDQIEGSADDPFLASGASLFGPGTVPDTRSNNDTSTGIEVEVLSDPADTMEVQVRFLGRTAGWPRFFDGVAGLYAADANADGEVELIVDHSQGVSVVSIQGASTRTPETLWSVPGTRFLAASDVNSDGAVELFLQDNQELSAWRVETSGDSPGAASVFWSVPLAEPAVSALVTQELGLFPTRHILALTGVELTFVDAQTGEVVEGFDASSISGAGPIRGLSVADTDGNGSLELLVATSDRLFSLGEDGAEERIGVTALSEVAGVAAADLDGDGIDEVVLVRSNGGVEIFGGGDRDDRPVTASMNDNLQSPTIGDLDADGFLEVVVTGSQRLHAIRHDGLNQPDFPLSIPRNLGLEALTVPAMLANLDGAAGQEVVLGTSSGLHGVAGGELFLPGFPLATNGGIKFSPVAADLDGDGSLELGAATGVHVYVWEPSAFKTPYLGATAAWGQDGGSAARTFTPSTTAARPAPDLAADLLVQNPYVYPNPVRGEELARIRFSLDEPARIVLEVFDSIGGRVQRIVREQSEIDASHNEIGWPVSSYASGLYVIRLRAETADRSDVALVRLAVSK